MSYLTERKLANTLDIPVALPSTELKQGDWIVIATVKVTSPMKLSLRALHFQLLASSVDPADIDVSNKVSPALGFAYVALYSNYSSSAPSTLVSLDALVADDLGVFTRSTSALEITTPGFYSILAVNNMKSSTSGDIDPTTSINFRVLVTGQVRLDLEAT